MGTRQSAQPKQRLMYVHAQTPNVLSPILDLTVYEPVPGFSVELDVDPPESPYRSVHDAVCDGWQIVQFPLHQAAYDDDDLDVIGYEFVLQKMEAVEPPDAAGPEAAGPEAGE